MKRREKTPREALVSALSGLPVFAYSGLRMNVMERLERLERFDRGGPGAMLEAAGIVRQLWSDLDVAVRAEEPDWRSVKALHRVWIAAIKLDKAQQGGSQ